MDIKKILKSLRVTVWLSIALVAFSVGTALGKHHLPAIDPGTEAWVAGVGMFLGLWVLNYWCERD